MKPRSFRSRTQEIEDLGLDRDIEGRGRLVQEQELRLQHQGPRDAHPLTLAAGQLMGIAVAEALVQADGIERIGDALVALADALDLQRFAQAPVDGLTGMKRAIGILKDDLHRPAEGAIGMARGGAAIDQDLSLPVAVEPTERAQDRGLARSGFADDAEAFALGNGERDAAHGMDPVVAMAEDDMQVAHFEDHQDSASQAGSRFSVASTSLGFSMLGRDSSKPRL